MRFRFFCDKVLDMGIRLKVLLTFILCFIVMAGVSLSLLERSVNESYETIERNDIAANMGRVEQSFEASAASLKNQANDWAVWNEMYHYVLHPDPDWVNENIGENALGPADLSMAMVLGKDGRVLTANSLSHDGAKLNVITPQLAPYLERFRRDTQKTQCGIIKLDAGLMLTCWAGIVQSDGSGEVVGKVIMGRLLDSVRLWKLREQTKLPFDLRDKPELPKGLTPWVGLIVPGPIGGGDFWASSDPDVYHLFYPVQDILGLDVGLVTLDVLRSVHKQGLMLYEQVRNQLALTVLIMTILLGVALNFMLIRRLSRFAKQIRGLEAQSTWDARIDIGGDDELGLVAKNFNKLLTLIKFQVEGLHELLGAKENAIRVIQATQAQLVRSEREALQGQKRVSNLLNNSGQGFLSFGGDLVIDPETSRACTSMLGCSPAGRHAAQVLMGDDTAGKELFSAIVPAVLAESDPGIRESMLSLLPAEIARDDRLLKAEYRLLEDDKFMVVLTDITEERRLEILLQSERRRLEFVVFAVSDKRNFFDAIDSFRAFLAHSLPRVFAETTAPQTLVRWLYREIHTYKGLFNQFSFIHTPQRLHEIETLLSDFQSRGDALTRQDIVDIVDTLSPHNLQAPFDDDLAVLSGALGDDFLEHGKSIVLSSELLLRLERLAARLQRGEMIDPAEDEIHTLLKEIVTLRKVTLKDVLMDFDGLIKQVAARLGKDVSTLEVHGGDDFWIDPHPYQPFLHALGHVFRNAVAHGLETPDSRWLAGKSAAGKISCHVALENKDIRLSIADDGAGINLDALRKRAVAAGIYAANEVWNIPNDDIVSLIFKDAISTGGDVTEISGRGVGLAAVRDETLKMGGDLAVKTTTDQGTEFIFRLPLLATGNPERVDAATARQPINADVELVMQSIVAKTQDYFEDEHQISVVPGDSDAGDLKHLRRLDVTVMICLGGKINLCVVFSMRRSLADAVYERMTAGFDDHAEEREDYREAAIGEVVNTILGHCTTDIQHLDGRGIAMTPPLILDRRQPIPQVHHTAYYTQRLNSAQGPLDISILGPQEIFDTPLITQSE